MKSPRKHIASAKAIPKMNMGRAAWALRARGRTSQRMIVLTTNGASPASQMGESENGAGGCAAGLSRK